MAEVPEPLAEHLFVILRHSEIEIAFEEIGVTHSVADLSVAILTDVAGSYNTRLLDPNITIDDALRDALLAIIPGRQRPQMLKRAAYRAAIELLCDKSEIARKRTLGLKQALLDGALL